MTDESLWSTRQDNGRGMSREVPHWVHRMEAVHGGREMTRTQEFVRLGCLGFGCGRERQDSGGGGFRYVCFQPLLGMFEPK